MYTDQTKPIVPKEGVMVALADVTALGLGYDKNLCIRIIHCVQIFLCAKIKKCNTLLALEHAQTLESALLVIILINFKLGNIERVTIP